ncbi:unnamed protein product [Ceutorhynchus assimilis]|uniref:Condensin complex subunit 1 n=1 Tax=Ceutorhynchus assimilis TaxID=467358 RepID=A0A9N9MQU8_9CUCU|nr:unnamed protein product [Ceutorhynchus assimilis]
MANFKFNIPSKLVELLTEADESDYHVKNVIVTRELLGKLKEARQTFRDEGPEFIIDYFDVYYSVLHNEGSIPMDVLFNSYKDLQTAATDLSKILAISLEDKSMLDDELKQKYQNIIKMLMYVYTQTILLIEHKNVVSIKNQGLLKGRNKQKDETAYSLNKSLILQTLNKIIYADIETFWDPPVVEENLINIIAEVCYKLLANPQVKAEKEIREEIFNVIGTLIKKYNLSTTFAIRMSQMIKDEEHLIQCVSEGLKQLVEKFNCKGLIPAIIREITEWQTEEKFQDSQGSKFCAQFLTAMAISMSDLMLPQLMYLCQYLNHESVPLRNSVLNVITEIIINVLSGRVLDTNQQECLDVFMTILKQHMWDTSAHVRSRVMQHWSRLLKESAIPKYLINELLEDIVKYMLHDKSALVRKNAAHCVTDFLSYNLCGSDLCLSRKMADLESNRQELEKLQPKVDEAKLLKAQEVEANWKEVEPDLRRLALEALNENDEEDNQNDNEGNQNAQQQANNTELIRMYLAERKYKDAFQLLKKTTNFDDENNEKDDEDMEMVDKFMAHIKNIFFGLSLDEIRSRGLTSGDFILTQADFEKFEQLEKNKDFLTECVNFGKLIDDAIEVMTELLETTSITDMQEAVAFFVTAYRFNIDNSAQGIMAMLKMMQRNEQDRKDMIVKAFKDIYLNTSSSTTAEHASTIVNRLIGLLKKVDSVNMDNLESIVTHMVEDGAICNNVIDMLWQYFTRKISVTDEQCHASVELLTMCAIKRRTIIERNVKLVTSIAFDEFGQRNMGFLGSCCAFLALIGRNRINTTSENPPFKIASDDTIFKELFAILSNNFFKPVEFYHHALSKAIEFVYKVSGQPDQLCGQFIKEVVEKLSKKDMIPGYVLMHLCQLMGIVAVQHLDYLDETVYKELKRRDYIRNNKKEQQETDKGKSKKKNKKKQNASKNNQSTLTNASSVTDAANHEESILEGAQAEDEDAEFILRVLERDTVTNSGLLAQLAPVIINICEKPEIFPEVCLQGAAVTALIRYMLVSSEFCVNNIQLLFTIFQKTKHSDIKVSILVHLSDLLTKFPNIIEPWTSHIFERLMDPSIEIRKATFFTLSGLILRDMIRAHSSIHLMVNSLIDTDEELSSMCRKFFQTLAQKEDNLYHVLPDIFSYLMESQEITDDQVKYIMKFLFELMDKSKHMENLVERFSAKFGATENIRHHRHIANCLSFVVYNDRALRKLLEKFDLYKNLVHDPEIYGILKNIMQSCTKQQVGKTDLKPIVAELEKCINSMFELNGDARPMRPPPKSAKKRVVRKKKGRKMPDSDEDDD